MKHIPLLITSLLLSSLPLHAQASKAYQGQFLYQYEGGNVYRVTVNDAKSMVWKCIAGSEKGAHGTEKPERIKVDDNIYFATWREKTGINVTQVIDLKNMKVYSTIIDGKERYVLSGKIVREK
ncbi:hypothetical protein LG204_00200 [Methylovorus menthalis]|uniref:MoaF-related domain-containing protein n=1 Tax=Methylovorus menthalis TaxID=1002227 RepID=UPI001E4AC3D6|nr:MoaF C-terminal domain-containing protein [Methylovorus menthalis]MCB4809735.1 hypothetical protein [Methylovorus menthalis]